MPKKKKVPSPSPDGPEHQQPEQESTSYHWQDNFDGSQTLVAVKRDGTTAYTVALGPGTIEVTLMADIAVTVLGGEAQA